MPFPKSFFRFAISWGMVMISFFDARDAETLIFWRVASEEMIFDAGGPRALDRLSLP